MVDVGESELGLLGQIRVPALEPEFPKNSCDDNQDEQQTTQYKGFHRGQIWIWGCSNKLNTLASMVTLIKTQGFLRLTWTSILHVNFEPSDWSIWDSVRWCNISACPYWCIFRRAVLWCTKGLKLLWCKQCFSTIFLKEKFTKTTKSSLFIHPHIVKNWHVSCTWNYKRRCLAEQLKI